MPNIRLNPSVILGVLALASSLLLGCGQDDTKPQAAVASNAPAQVGPELNDTQATAETRALYANLARLRMQHLLFGHQDDLAYGVHWEGDADRSDVRDVTGSDPAVYGWELGGLDIDQAENLDRVNFAKMQGWIKTGYARGGVITISWHMFSPVTGGNAWDKRPTVHELLPGGSKHDALKTIFDKFVAFNEQLASVDSQGQKHYIPIIFRPWHEHNGDWFWWGKGNCSEADYQALWRFTVHYLRDVKGLHNLIYAYSPDRGRIDMNDFEAGYFYGYPGDAYVDIIGLDDYWDVGHEANKAPAAEQSATLTASLKHIVQIARTKHKIAALTETGNNRLTIPHFWTQRILAPIMADPDAQQIAYMLVWRNANLEREKSEQYFAPFPGQATADDFKAFYASPEVMFANELPDMYH